MESAQVCVAMFQIFLLDYSRSQSELDLDKSIIGLNDMQNIFVKHSLLT